MAAVFIFKRNLQLGASLFFFEIGIRKALLILGPGIG